MHSHAYVTFLQNAVVAPDPDRMILSEDGARHERKVSRSEYFTIGGEGQRNLERLREACEIDSTESEGGDERSTLTTPPSANELLSETALENIKGITEVHGVPLTEPASTAAIAMSMPTAAVDKKTEDLEYNGSVTEIIQQFSSDESLASVLRQVEHQGHFKNTGEVSSSSCSCDTVIDFRDNSTNNAASLQQDNELYDQIQRICLYLVLMIVVYDCFRATNNATVLSWVTEVAAGLTSDCKTRSDECLGEEFDIGVNVISEVSAPAFVTEEPRRAQTAILGDKEFESQSRIAPAGSSCGPSDRSQIMTAVSPKSTTDTTEFFYVEPNDVLRALAAFCHDHHSKIKT